MILRWLAWIIWLFFALVFMIFGNDFGTRTVFFASIIVPVSSIIITVVLATKIEVKIPDICLCDELIKFENMKFDCKNLFVGEEYKNIEIAETKYCGILEFKEIFLMDFFGLSKWKVRNFTRDKTLVLPRATYVEHSLNPQEIVSNESEHYSMYSPGNDPSETFAIREYAPADPLKSIHWKLSKKMDKLLVRELGLPIENNIFMKFETAETPEKLHENAVKLYSISLDLIKQNTPHALTWSDAETDELKHSPVNSESDLNSAMFSLFSTAGKMQ
jgi:hypothetical protein